MAEDQVPCFQYVREDADEHCYTSDIDDGALLPSEHMSGSTSRISSTYM